MSQALVATARIVYPYAVDGQQHKLKAYVRNLQLVSGTWTINSRATDANDTDWEDAAEGLEQALSYLHSGTLTSNADMILEQLTAGVWNPVATYTPVTSNAAGSYAPATQVTCVFRDTAFKKVKVVLMETTEVAPQHFVQQGAGNAAFDNMIKQFTSLHTVTTPPYDWLVSRGNRYLNTSPFVGATVTLNRKTRRARGLT